MSIIQPDRVIEKVSLTKFRRNTVIEDTLDAIIADPGSPHEKIKRLQGNEKKETHTGGRCSLSFWLSTSGFADRLANTPSIAGLGIVTLDEDDDDEGPDDDDEEDPSGLCVPPSAVALWPKLECRDLPLPSLSCRGLYAAVEAVVADVKRLVLEDTDAAMYLRGLVRRVRTRDVGDMRLGFIDECRC